MSLYRTWLTVPWMDFGYGGGDGARPANSTPLLEAANSGLLGGGQTNVWQDGRTLHSTEVPRPPFEGWVQGGVRWGWKVGPEPPWVQGVKGGLARSLPSEGRGGLRGSGGLGEGRWGPVQQREGVGEGEDITRGVKMGRERRSTGGKG